MVRKKKYKKWETVDPYHALDVLGYFPDKDIKYHVSKKGIIIKYGTRLFKSDGSLEEMLERGLVWEPRKGWIRKI